ncbi:hypothetical protein HYDPIDRAFT_26436 [Hydnomerulius pinastri MD-312]|nr:hypothetical protein HYDPIDRAFT_26436 [Hydnomerulius pinastri MD-312]
MAFNSSAFGSNTTSLFGQSKPTGSLFGSTQPAAPGMSAFGQPQTQQQPQGTSLFGGGTLGQTGQNQQQQQQPTTSLFGQPASGTQQQQQQQQQQPTTSLFGQPAGGIQQQQPTTSLFGQPAGGAQQQPQSTFGTSLFGNPTQSNAPPQQTTGLFGTSAQQQPAQQTTSLFGSTLQPQPTVHASGFGAGASTAGSSLFGQQRQPSSMNVSPLQATGPPLFSKSTKFNDLPDEIKKRFESLDSHIQGRVQISNDLKTRKLGREPTKGQELMRDELLSVAATVQSDVLFTKDLKAKTDQAVQDTIIATRIIDGFRNPQQNGAFLKNHASFPLEFFIRVTQQMQERLLWYKNTIEQIERKLSSTAIQAQSTPQSIASTLQTQHAIFVSLAAKTASVDAELQKVKALYTQLWRAKTGSMRDPFNDLDRGSGSDFGMESLHVK